MAGTTTTDSYKSKSKPEKPILSDQIQENPTKFSSHFLYKAAVVTLFLIILPLFPSQAPDFINQNLLTRSWELLHLLFVGIAISYGLFSRKNDDTEKENDKSNSNSKFENAQSYVSRFLQVSSVFDDESLENPSGSDENKVQTWSSQYYRNEPPVVVVAQESSVLDKNGGTGSRTGERGRPLLLPVRSLKSRIPEPENGVVSGSVVSRSDSKTGSRRFSSGSNREFAGLGCDKVEEKLKESVVLPSPIPWRSRSGRLEMKEEVESGASMAEPEFIRVESRAPRPQSSRSGRPNSSSSSPKLSPSPSLSSRKKISESQAKISEDMVKKKTLYDKSFSPPAPPPPPPPPSFYYKSSSFKPSSGSTSSFPNDGISLEKELRRSLTTTSEPNDLKRSRFDGSSMGKSVRTVRADDNIISHEGLALKQNKQVFNELPEEEEDEDLVEKMLMESDEVDSESEDDEIGGRFAQKDVVESPKQSAKNKEEAASSPSSNNVGDGGPDVDKKADEFIAKFREQIRLQRIESIKRSSAQMSRNLAR
ncbi:hydroxyproline-rich glycoprotein family protein [Trema orientale]|nr:hydroxyproline-rich glycoprotein family protein [Trema orientale]